jgi:predicted nuclease of restriction endonuclease-like (RecB) superfamily
VKGKSMQPILNNNIYKDIKSLIEQTKQNVATTVNSALTLLYWNIGKHINDEILKNNRAAYGQEIVQALSAQLTQEYGKGYSKQSLLHMCKFNEIFNDLEIVSALWRQLTWTHFKTIIYIEDELKREFYIGMIKLDRWSTRTLKDRIDSQLYERTALSKKPDELISYEIEKLHEGEISPNIILKDPYILDFLELNDRYLEKDLEDAILRDIEQFILELGSGFSFISRQKIIQIDDEDFKIDLLFYNRKLKRLIAIELKLGKFKASYKGQMELYLRYLEKYEKEEDENSPIGIILCADKQSEQIELLELDKSNIHVAQYLTVLPAKEILEQKLHQAIANAKARLENKIDE